MSIRLPDFYYTSKMLDSTNAQMGPKQLGLSFNQGEECKFKTYLNMFGKPFDLDKYELTVVVKKNDWASRLIWRGTVGNGIFPVDGVPGFFEVWMPSIVTSMLKAGAYHFGFTANEKIGATNSVWDSRISLREDIIQILRSADMPNAGQGGTMEIITRYNADTGLWEYVAEMIEPTAPLAVPVLNGSTPDSANNTTAVTEDVTVLIPE